jgi:DNA (cytosine-5)-methyltransferase 1
MFKAIDLFSGIGGIRRGFELTNEVEIVLSAEINKYACKTYEHLFGDNPFNDVASDEFKEKVKNIKYDILLGGFPCQAFSIAGKKEGFEDKTRGTLFFEIADILDKTKLKAFFLENVEGLITHKSGDTFKTILEVLVLDLGYKVVGVEEKEGKLIYNKNSFVRNSKNFGVPQNRPRTYIIGFKKDIIPNGFSFEDLPTGRDDLNLYRDLNDLLETNPDDKYYVASGYLETLKRHRKNHKLKGNGFGYEVVNREGVKNPIANTLLATGGSGKERNLVFDKKEGLAGKVVKGKKTPINSEGIRHMTPDEWGKLQGFINYAFKNNDGIDLFSFPEDMSDSQKYKQFGNSVTIPVIEVLAQYMIDNLNKMSTY